LSKPLVKFAFDFATTTTDNSVLVSLSATLVTWLSIPIDALSSWKNNGFGGYTFTYMIDPSSVADMVKAQQDAMSRSLQRKLASMTDTAAILNTLIAAKLSDGSLCVHCCPCMPAPAPAPPKK